MSSGDNIELRLERLLDHIAEDAGWSDAAVTALVGRILSLPEIAEALSDQEAAYENGYSAGFNAARTED